MHYFLFIFIALFIKGTTLSIKSSAFENNAAIPEKYSCEGENINPSFSIQNIPVNAQSLALIMDDPDAKGTFVHWVMWNIPTTGMIDENSAPGTQGKNGRDENKYTGPCPPNGTHHYHFKFYALDSKLDLAEGADKKALQKAMEGHIIASGDIVGTYKKAVTAEK